ncbi:MAG TPA: hypothetical protein VNA13_03100 [Xanthomonadales bacterium]|nr:hypothetical protein [Xanthomonadales bacterium]
MVSVEQVRSRVKWLRTYVKSMSGEPEAKQIWRGKERGVEFTVFKYAALEEAVIGDYTGIELNLSGRWKVRREVINDFVRALGKPTAIEKTSGRLKRPEVLIWNNNLEAA